MKVNFTEGKYVAEVEIEIVKYWWIETEGDGC